MFPVSEAAFWTIAVGALTNASCAILGCYLVLRRMSLLGDAISHSILPGIALAFLLAGRNSLAVFAGAMLMGLLTTLLTQSLHALGKVPEDASMGVVFTSLFAIGVILITNAAPRVDLDPGCVLYGLIELAPLDLVEVAGIEVPRNLPVLTVALVLTLLLVTLFWKEFKIVSFDPGLATAMGISALLFHYLLMAMVAGVTVASFEAVGSVLVVAMLIVPAATAHLLTDRLGWMMVWAVVIGIISALAGYAFGWAGVAPMMAVAAGVQFGLAAILAPRHGVLSKAWHNLALATRIAGEDILAQLYRREESLAHAGAAVTSAELTVSQATRGDMWAWLALPRLWSRGDIHLRGSMLELTNQGKELARSLVRSHRLWESYLGEHFQLPLDHLHAPAERIEHFIGPELQSQLAAELEHVRDPHGREIPPGKPAD
jgi:ABC-type Mn2+/Zn2+ transport system permease subunit/Mn-dependent DtxR family transcriptional regulator